MDYRGTARSEIQNMFHEPDFVSSLVAKHAETELDDVEIRAVAPSVSTIYSSKEKTILHGLQDQHGSRSEGPNWCHAELLDIAGRKTLLSDDVRSLLRLLCTQRTGLGLSAHGPIR